MRIIFIDKTLAIRTQLLFLASVNNTLQFVKGTNRDVSDERNKTCKTDSKQDIRELSQYEWKCEIKEQKITTIFITPKGKKTCERFL